MQHAVISQHVQGDVYLQSPVGQQLCLAQARQPRKIALITKVYRESSPYIRTKHHLIILRPEEELPAGDGVLLAAAVTVPAEGGACRQIPKGVCCILWNSIGPHEGFCQLQALCTA